MVYTTVTDDGMTFSLGNWRYWLFAAAVVLTLVGVVIGLFTAAPDTVDTDAGRLGYTVGRALGGVLCAAVVPGALYLAAAFSKSDRARRMSFGASAVAAVALSAVVVISAGAGLARHGSHGSRKAREAAYKQAFATIDGYVAPYSKVLDAFSAAGGASVKTLIGAQTIAQRMGMAVKVKNANLEAKRLLEGAEPALNEWFAQAGVGEAARDAFWENRKAREYLAILTERCVAEEQVSAVVIEFLRVMHAQAENFGTMSDGTILFKTQEDLEAFRAIADKVSAPMRKYGDVQAAVERMQKELASEAKKRG